MFCTTCATFSRRCCRSSMSVCARRGRRRAFAPAALAQPGALPRMRFGTWVGGDRDGHPGVTAEVTAETLEQLRLHGARVVATGISPPWRTTFRFRPGCSRAPPELQQAIARQQEALGHAAAAHRERGAVAALRGAADRAPAARPRARRACAAAERARHLPLLGGAAGRSRSARARAGEGKCRAARAGRCGAGAAGRGSLRLSPGAARCPAKLRLPCQGAHAAPRRGRPLGG